MEQSTTSRLPATLESLQFVERDAVSTLYRLGLGVNVAVRQGSSLFYLCNFEGRLAPKAFALMGQRNPLHATGIGKCLPLALTPAQRRELIPDLHRYTPRTICDHDDLDAALAEVAHRGYATEVEELALDARASRHRSSTSPAASPPALSISGPLSALGLADGDPELAGTVIEVAVAPPTPRSPTKESENHVSHTTHAALGGRRLGRRSDGHRLQPRRRR